MDQVSEIQNPPKKKHPNFKYIIYILIVLVATGISLTISLYGNFDTILEILKSADFLWVAVIIGLVTLSYMIEGLVIKIFCRLYTRHYHYHQGLANSMIGAFYNDVTPGASGGQVMQAYTLKQQGLPISSGASIMVMWFILYQFALLIFDVLALIFEAKDIFSIKTIDIGSFVHIPLIPLIIVGFLLNLSVIIILYGMSFSHKLHNFILHYVVGFLGKIHIIKKPDQVRENLRVQVENFKIELRRLQANIPVTILIIVLFLLVILCRDSIPYFAGLALHAYTGPFSFDVGMLFKATFLSAFHQMVTGLIPLPGAAGISEYFFYYLFFNFYGNTYSTLDPTLVIRYADANVKAAQILWRTATYHLVLLVSGFVAALYRSRPKEQFQYSNRQTFVNLQLETFDERKRSSDTMFETRQLSRKEIQRKIAESTMSPREKAASLLDRSPKQDTDPSIKMASVKPVKIKKKKNKGQDDGWGTIDIDN